jgi:hypothetical protein
METVSRGISVAAPRFSAEGDARSCRMPILLEALSRHLATERRPRGGFDPTVTKL